MRHMWQWTAVAVTVLIATGFRFPVHDAAPPDLPARCERYVDTRGRSRAPSVEADRVWPRWDAVPSPADRLKLNDLDARTTLSQLDRFRVIERFALPSSGVVVVVHSDGDVRPDVAAVDELFHARLRLHARHPHPLQRARMRCFKERIVDERAFAGSIVNLYVPSDPAMCIRNVRLVKRPPGSPWRDHCHWKGATPPVRLSGILGEVRLSEYHMVIAPGITGWTNAQPNPVVARILRHESDHLWDWMMNVSPLHVRANERRVVGGDSAVARHYRDHDMSLPNPFVYGGASGEGARAMAAPRP